MAEFREGLMTSLSNNFVGAYLHGSIAFPEYSPEAGDIDFYVVTRRSLNGTEIKSLAHLHRSLAAKLEFGGELDGFYIRIYGPRASRIFSRPNWKEIRSALYRQLVYVRKIIDSDPWWSVLNLCRLVYTFKTENVAVSKLVAARWALKKLPSRWKPVIRSAVKRYKGTANRRDRTILRKDARKFLGFASVRVIAFDIASNSRRQETAYLRSSRTGTRR